MSLMSMLLTATLVVPLGVADYDWPVDEARVIVECESSWKPEAVGDAGASIGLFQIAWDNVWGRYEYPVGIREAADVPAGMTVRETKEWLMVPENNVRVAYHTWRLRGESWSGWGGWSCAREL